MQRKWVHAALWVGLGLFFVAGFVGVPLGIARGWFVNVGDDWGHLDLARHLKRRGIDVEVSKEVAGSDAAIFTDGAGARVVVIRCRDRTDAEIQDRTADRGWVEHFAVGPFFVGTSKQDGVSLCRRIKRAVK